MASKRKPLNGPAPIEPKAKFTHCAFPSCTHKAHRWLRIVPPGDGKRARFVPVCIPCFASLPTELKTLDAQ